MKGRIKEDDRSVPLQATATGSTGRRSSPARNIATGIASRSRGGAEQLIFDENRARPRARNISASAPSRSAPTASASRDPGRRRRLGAVQARRPRPRHRQGPRDRHRGRHRQPGVDRAIRKGLVFTEVNDQWRSYRARYHRIGDDPAKADDALRGKGRHRLLGRGRPHHRRQPDLHLDRQQFAPTKSASSPPTSPTRRRSWSARARPTANMRSTPRTANCGS